MEIVLIGRQVSIFEWYITQRSACWSTIRFKVKEQEDKVYRLKKALYGLKQAPKTWYDEIDTYFNKFGLEKSPSEVILYIKFSDAGILIVSLYVFNIIYKGSSYTMIQEFKMEMMK